MALAIAVYLSAGSAHALAPPPPSPYLTGLTAVEGTALVSEIIDAQAGLSAGAPLTLMLLLGATASHPNADVSALDAFLGFSFDFPLHIARTDNDSLSRRYYILGYEIDERSKMAWTVEVITRSDGNIERVTMVYGSPTR